MEKWNSGVLYHTEHCILSQDLMLVLHDTFNVLIVAFIFSFRINVYIIICTTGLMRILHTLQWLLRWIPHLELIPLILNILNAWCLGHLHLMIWVLILVYALIINNLLNLIILILFILIIHIVLIFVCLTHVTQVNIIFRGSVVEAKLLRVILMTRHHLNHTWLLKLESTCVSFFWRLIIAFATSSFAECSKTISHIFFIL
jgi:hypothetical protein